jgi:SpoVK/Ycf46/Vps4 family AAA+-type ATPase
VAIWRRYVEDITHAEVDVSVLVDATELFTPADIEFAARKAAQHAFECEHFGRTAKRATTQDFLAAIEQTRPTLAQDSSRGLKRTGVGSSAIDDLARPPISLDRILDEFHRPVASEIEALSPAQTADTQSPA